MLVKILNREVQLADIKQSIQMRTREDIDRQQREYFLQQQIKNIQDELGAGQEDEIDELRQKGKTKKWYGSSYQPNPNQPYRSRRSARMEAASLILGSIALLSCTCLYLAVPCGALAVIFATLSRGGMMSYTSKAQIGMILGIIALIATIVLYASVLGYAIHQYGSIDGFLKAYSDMQGMDYNELMKQFMAK